MTNYEMGEKYDRKSEIHAIAKAAHMPSGNNSAGITRVGNDQCIFWNPYRGTYANRWIDGTHGLIYSGEGSRGDMLEIRGNADLIDCEESKEGVLVFYKVARAGSQWMYMGSYEVRDHRPGVSQDLVGNWRRDIRFYLTRLGKKSLSPDLLPKMPPKKPLPMTEDLPMTEQQIWEAMERKPSRFTPQRARRTRIQRNKRESDPLKTLYVRKRAVNFGGTCELCGVKPGWATASGQTYYQAHHIDRDVDTVDWIAAVCGTCHDRLHHSSDRLQMAIVLRRVVSERQVLRNRPLYEPDRPIRDYPTNWQLTDGGALPIED